MRCSVFHKSIPGGKPYIYSAGKFCALEALGITIIRYALRPGPHLVEPDDEEEKLRTSYILQAGILHVIRRCIVTAITRPIPLLETLAQALRIGWKSDRGLSRHFVYLLEAVVLGSWCLRDNVDHIHAHFGTNAAAIAMFASHIFRIPYSFTVHGPEEFDKAPLIALAEKIRQSQFVVAISSYGRSQLYRAVEKRQWGKIKVVHCGLEPDYFRLCRGYTAPQTALFVSVD